MPLLSLIGQFVPSIKSYVDYKAQALQYDRDYKLALLQAQAAQTTAQLQADSADLRSRLEATSSSFKQTTFWLLWVPVFSTIIFPKRAQEMWNNFNLIPQMFQWLFMSVYASIWGIPVVKNGFGSITDLLTMRWDKKIEKAAVDRKAVFDVLKKTGVFKGSANEVVAIDRALDAGEGGNA